MHFRIVMSAVSLATLMLVFVSCGDAQPAPARTSTPSSTPTPTAASVSVSIATPAPVTEPTPTSISVPTPMPTPAPTPTPDYLADETSPCTPVPGSSVDPCERGVATFRWGYGADSVDYPPDGDRPESVQAVFTGDSSFFVPHLVLRGTYLPKTVRCTSGDRFRPLPYLSRDDYEHFEGSRALKCYVDLRVNAYIVGEGPSKLTILRFWYHYGGGDFGDGSVAEEESIAAMRQQFESGMDDRPGLDGVLAGVEEILFLWPPYDLSSEAWQWAGSWGVERQEDGVVIAVHPDRHLWKSYRSDEYETYRSTLETELVAFTQAVKAEYQAYVTEYDGRIGADESLPMLVTDANHLRQFFTAVGAYSAGSPTPVQPPPPKPVSVTSPTPAVPPVSTATSTMLRTPTPVSMQTATSDPAPTYLTGQILPCTPVSNSSVDPCDPNATPIDMGMAQYVPDLGNEPLSIREMLDDDPPPAWVPHLAFRGTFSPAQCVAPPAILSVHHRICRMSLVTLRTSGRSSATSTCA